MRTFTLLRVVDPSGISGTGVVAQGVVFDDGTCALRWLTAHRSTAVYDSVETLEKIHGHGGKTQILEDLEAPSDAWRELRAAAGEVSTDAACDALEQPFRNVANPQNERPDFARINPEVLRRLGAAILKVDAIKPAGAPVVPSKAR